ncbi:MAG TPA: HPr family phosphocarrier protein [Candidatus Omnitrophota bacterium]|nr:HPr family phosphocarrier protein [Candidatus Omnitrophota bacterium]HPB68039.1 HPr family phosphocarrier protein [Candidatus Omnitrophota bacterium]HQO57364.1 HPr family phosphocarrier protein [Candidatus Omnitrophota bacterium]HQP11538.1 HPr family phosphocarrier protein [Candidatus Omnitrophota bacterium]
MPRIEKELTVLNEQGLHARPAAFFVQIAAKFDASVTVSKDGESVNGKSIMGILMLGAEKHSKLLVCADGNDAEQLMQELEEFLSKNE